MNCDATCASCSGSANTECLTCPGSVKVLSYVPAGGPSGECLDQCPVGFYQDASRVCQPCDSSCKTCNGPTPNECLTCFVPGNNKYFYLNECLNVCPTSTLTIEGAVPTCEACINDCYTCSSTTSNCSSCSGNLVLDGQSCGTTCPSGQYPEIALNAC